MWSCQNEKSKRIKKLSGKAPEYIFKKWLIRFKESNPHKIILTHALHIELQK